MTKQNPPPVTAGVLEAATTTATSRALHSRCRAYSARIATLIACVSIAGCMDPLCWETATCVPRDQDSGVAQEAGALHGEDAAATPVRTAASTSARAAETALASTNAMASTSALISSNASNDAADPVPFDASYVDASDAAEPGTAADADTGTYATDADAGLPLSGDAEPAPSDTSSSPTASSSTAEPIASSATGASSSAPPDPPVLCQQDSCDVNATCSVINNSITCACDEGFVEDGQGCRPIVTYIAAGDVDTCAIFGAGQLRCWGNGQYGRLGNGGTGSVGDTQPASAGGLVDLQGRRPIQLALGTNHTCALLDDGGVRCWGLNTSGELGAGDTVTRYSPVDGIDVKLGGKATQIAAGEAHTCAILDTGSVKCWGTNAVGQLGLGHTLNVGGTAYNSLAEVQLDLPATRISAGYETTCVLLSSGAVRCWGDGASGQLDICSETDIGNNEFPTVNASVGSGTVTSVDTGMTHSCVLLADGALRCWGSGGDGKLGYGGSSAIGSTPETCVSEDLDVGAAVINLGLGRRSTCVVLATGAVRCWGRNNFYQLGDPDTSSHDDVTTLHDIDLGGTAKAVVAGDTHTCALMTSGSVRCWGYHNRTGYGDGQEVGDDETPAQKGDVPLF